MNKNIQATTSLTITVRDISDQRLCRGVFTSVSEFEAAIDNRLPQQKFKAGYLDSKSL